MQNTDTIGLFLMIGGIGALAYFVLKGKVGTGAAVAIPFVLVGSYLHGGLTSQQGSA